MPIGTAGAATFGKTTVGSVNLTSGFSADVKRCTLYSLSETGDVSSLSVYSGGLPGYGPSQTIRGVLYGTSGGVPTTRLAVSNQVTVTSTSAKSWKTLTLPSVVRLTPGTYCLGILSGATAGTASFSYDPVPGSWFKNADTYSDGASNPFGAYETGDLQMSLYATYAPVVPPQVCNKTQLAGESFPAFVARLGANEHGCLIAGTYDISTYDPSGRFANFKTGQVIKAKANADGRRQVVTVRGELLLDVPGVQLEDFTVAGTTDHAAVDLRNHNLALRYMNIDSSPRNHSTQGVVVGGDELQIQNVVIERTRIHHQGNTLNFDHGIYCQNTSSGRFQGNWIYDNAAYGMHMYTNCDGIDFTHNVVSDNGLGIVFANDTSGTTVRNGVVSFNTDTNRERGIRTSALVGTGNVVRDHAYWQVENFLGGLTVTNYDNENPGYVNRAARDYRLSATSPSREELGTYADAVPGPRT